MRLFAAAWLAAASVVATAAADGSATAKAFHFEDVSKAAGVTAPTWCGGVEKPHILESGGTGLALFDYDRDGDLDLYLVNGWKLDGPKVAERGRNVLYRNRGDGSFEDVTAQAGVGDDGWGCGVAVGDFDGDHWPDLFVTNFGKDVLYRNQGKAGGRFAAVADGPGIDGWSAGAAFFDADGDGDEDLYVGGYIDCTLEEVLNAKPTLDWEGTKVMLGPFGLEGKANAFFENVQGRFLDATAAAGLVDKGLYYSFGLAALDLDADRDLDLYVANDSNPNYMYRNDGKGRFQEAGLWSGASLDQGGNAQAGMGLAAGDVDGDGVTDLFVTNFAKDTSTLYRNLGDFMFEDVTRGVGLREATFKPLSWGTVLEDFDLDGDLDLFVANGHIYPQADRVPKAGTSYAQRNLLLEGKGGRFLDVSNESGPGLAALGSSRGVVAGDLDGDGDIDLVIANVDAPPTVLRNDSPRRGAWLLVDAPGALRVEVTVGQRRWARDLVIGATYVSVSDRRFHFGLGPATRADRVKVLWPGGGETELKNVGVDRVLEVERGDS